jgi:hypothetical protein
MPRDRLELNSDHDSLVQELLATPGSNSPSRPATFQFVVGHLGMPGGASMVSNLTLVANGAHLPLLAHTAASRATLKAQGGVWSLTGAAAPGIHGPGLGSTIQGDDWRQYFPSDAYPGLIAPKDEVLIAALVTGIVTIGLTVFTLAADIADGSIVSIGGTAGTSSLLSVAGDSTGHVYAASSGPDYIIHVDAGSRHVARAARNWQRRLQRHRRREWPAASRRGPDRAREWSMARRRAASTAKGTGRTRPSSTSHAE